MSAPRVAEIARRWPEGVRLLLLHGYDPSASLDHASAIVRGLVDPANPTGLERMTGEQIIADPTMLVAAAGSISMFGGQTVIRVDGVDDKAAAALARVLEGPVGNPVIAVAEGLKRASPLLALAGRPGVLAIESKDARASDVPDFAKEFGLRADREAAQALFDACAGERSLIRRELEKMALYLDASPETPKPLDAATVAAVGAGIEPFDQNGLIAAILTGREAEAATILATMPDGMWVPTTRALAGRLLALADMRRAVDGGARAETVIDGARPPVFYKEKPVFMTALRRFSSARMVAALAALLNAERAVKSAGSLGELEVQALLLRLARG